MNNSVSLRRSTLFLLTLIALSVAPSHAEPSIKIFDGEPKTLVVNGYSTSFHWPAMLRRKLDRYTGDPGHIEVRSATAPGTPISRWVDLKSGSPRPVWNERLKPELEKNGGAPVIVLAQQSLQGVYGGFNEGIENENDRNRIKAGAEAIATYVGLLKRDGADLVILAMHIYKRPMEPGIENEKYALEEALKRNVPGLEPGPDVWTPTKRLYPKAFERDLRHPNSIGAEVMAQLWFERLLARESLDVPAWSREEMQQAIDGEPTDLFSR